MFGFPELPSSLLAMVQTMVILVVVVKMLLVLVQICKERQKCSLLEHYPKNQKKGLTTNYSIFSNEIRINCQTEKLPHLLHAEGMALVVAGVVVVVVVLAVPAQVD